jgi:hypothetical protein
MKRLSAVCVAACFVGLALAGPRQAFGHDGFFDDDFGLDGADIEVNSTVAPKTAPVQPCGPASHWDTGRGRCQPNRPLGAAPPAGFIVVHPEGRQEFAATCPPRSIEQMAGGWRFCLDPQHPGPAAALRTSTVAGVPYEEAVQILERHKEELLARPGVKAVGLEPRGLYVEADQPAELPAAVEGLPLAVYPPRPRNRE